MFGGSYNDVKEARCGKVLFKSEAPVYKVVKISRDLCLGFLKGNLSFCRKSHSECGAKHGGEGSIKFAVKALVLAKSATSAFGPPLLEMEVLETDLMECILSSRVSLAEWNLTCSQIRSMHEQDHSRKAMEHIQTSRKSKPKPNPDDWFAQNDDADSLGSPFEKIDTFNLEENQSERLAAEDR